MVLLPTPIGIIGCGNISTIYIENSKRLSNILLKGCADLDRSRAEAQVARFGLSKVYTVEEMLADPEIELIINLTIPAAHGDVALAAVQAGKSVYNEKPLTIKLEDAQRLMALAEAKGVRVGAAPDTFLGAGLQTCRQVIDSGEIGVPVAATAFMLGHGPEGWHPSPEFFYQVGGGPMFDMGPYYLTALVSLLGPVRRVTGATRISFPQDPHLIPSADDHQPAECRQSDERGNPYPCDGSAGFCQRPGCDDCHQLRRVGGGSPAHRNLWLRRHAESARPEYLCRAGARAPPG